MKQPPWSWRRLTPRAALPPGWPNGARTDRPVAWSAARRVPRFATCQPRASAPLGSTVAKRRTLSSRTVVIRVPSVAHITFGASVTIVRSCSEAGCSRARCGDSRAFSRISRSTRLRATRAPVPDAQPRPDLPFGGAAVHRTPALSASPLARPGPDHGERARSARIAASSAASDTSGFGPRRPVGREVVVS
jgi:hypothetical protein